MTEEQIIRILSFVIGVLLLGWFHQYLKNCKLDAEVQYLDMRLGAKKEELRCAREIILAMDGYSSEIYSDSVKEAVHYALLKSHPDNGGKQEDFIKFRELYKKMEGK